MSIDQMVGCGSVYIHYQNPGNWDKNGNLIKDGDYAYTYDAWNNLVSVKAQNDSDVAVATYAYYADDRRASKDVSNRGAFGFDGKTYFYYDGAEVMEERDGSNDMIQQFIYGPNHIDELAMIRGKYGAYWA